MSGGNLRGSISCPEEIKEGYITYIPWLLPQLPWYIIYVQKKFVIERTRDLSYLKFVVTDFFPKMPVKTPVT